MWLPVAAERAMKRPSMRNVCGAAFPRCGRRVIAEGDEAVSKYTEVSHRHIPSIESNCASWIQPCAPNSFVDAERFCADETSPTDEGIFATTLCTCVHQTRKRYREEKAHGEGDVEVVVEVHAGGRGVAPPLGQSADFRWRLCVQARVHLQRLHDRIFIRMWMYWRKDDEDHLHVAFRVDEINGSGGAECHCARESLSGHLLRPQREKEIKKKQT
jgi:hypothetical protein